MLETLISIAFLCKFPSTMLKCWAQSWSKFQTLKNQFEQRSGRFVVPEPALTMGPRNQAKNKNKKHQKMPTHKNPVEKGEVKMKFLMALGCWPFCGQRSVMTTAKNTIKLGVLFFCCVFWSLSPKQQQNNKPTNNNHQHKSKQPQKKNNHGTPNSSEQKSNALQKYDNNTKPNEEKHYRTTGSVAFWGRLLFLWLWLPKQQAKQQNNKTTNKQQKQQPKLNQATTTTKQQPWDPKFKQIKQQQQQTQTTTKTKTSNNNKMSHMIYRLLTVSPQDLHVFPFLSVSLRIFYLFPNLLLLIVLFFLFLLLAVLLSSFILAFLLSKPCKDNSTNKNTIKQGEFVAQTTKAKQQNVNNLASFTLKQNKGKTIK